MKKVLAFILAPVYNGQCCDMIAMKREVAAELLGLAGMAGFPWSECQVRKLTTSHCTDTDCACMDTSLHLCEKVQDTHGKVYSHRLSYFIKTKVRKGGDFFYGKSSNENHTESL